ncbi:MAG: triose-phosphate isomerase [Chloroflexota bacterium]
MTPSEHAQDHRDSRRPQAPRPKIVAGNWKMHTTVAEAVGLAGEVRDATAGLSGAQIVLCPPFVSLTAVAEVLADSPIALGAQNVHWVEKGAYTGEIAPGMLAGLCRYVIVGHSERRQYFGETDESVNRKVRAALDAGLRPIMCVGESLAHREGGATEAWLAEQITVGLRDLAPDDAPGIVVAYEPIWAIGTGRAATAVMANETIGAIRATLASVLGAVAATLPILYGGSVTAANFGDFAAQSEIDGALVGGASLKAVDFAAIARCYAR